jgi:3-phosphoglycerate kinase
MGNVRYIDSIDISNKRVLMRVDFNVSLKPDHTIANDTRIQQALPTIRMLLEHGNRLIMTAHLGRPKGRDPQFSLQPVVAKLQELFPDKKVILVDDFLKDKTAIENQQPNEIIMLENIRFYPEEKKNDEAFARSLSSLADVYVNDAFGVSHRPDASVVGVTKFMPSYGGLLLKKEVEMIMVQLRYRIGLHRDFVLQCIFKQRKILSDIRVLILVIRICWLQQERG